ncbi:MAG TPA: DUF2283 domain-containing protein [Candidatus Hydrogenedentes bacterium]|nr:DUF2283 domain-containing protein [Candidatus Hydrogenedentota bacterium]
MRIRYDPEVDAMSIVFRETTVTTRPLAEGIAAEYDAEGRLAGIEILDALKRFGDRSTLRQVILEGIGPGASPAAGVAEAPTDYRRREPEDAPPEPEERPD